MKRISAATLDIITMVEQVVWVMVKVVSGCCGRWWVREVKVMVRVMTRMK